MSGVIAAAGSAADMARSLMLTHMKAVLGLAPKP